MVGYNQPLLRDGTRSLEAIQQPEKIYLLHDDFFTFDDEASSGQTWVVANATAGTAAKVAGSGGVIRLDSGSTTADQGVQVQQALTSFYAQVGKEIHFEARIAVEQGATYCQFFVGLSEVDSTMFSSGANSSANHIGFEMNAVSLAATPDVLQFYGEKASARGTVTAVHTLTEGAYVRLGIRIVGTDKIEAYVNGDKVGELSSTYLPTAGLTPTFCCLSEGTEQPKMLVDYVTIIGDR